MELFFGLFISSALTRVYQFFSSLSLVLFPSSMHQGHLMYWPCYHFQNACFHSLTTNSIVCQKRGELHIFFSSSQGAMMENISEKERTLPAIAGKMQSSMFLQGNRGGWKCRWDWLGVSGTCFFEHDVWSRYCCSFCPSAPWMFPWWAQTRHTKTCYGVCVLHWQQFHHDLFYYHF